MDTMPA